MWKNREKQEFDRFSTIFLCDSIAVCKIWILLLFLLGQWWCHGFWLHKKVCCLVYIVMKMMECYSVRCSLRCHNFSFTRSLFWEFECPTVLYFFSAVPWYLSVAMPLYTPKFVLSDGIAYLQNFIQSFKVPQRDNLMYYYVFVRYFDLV